MNNVIPFVFLSVCGCFTYVCICYIHMFKMFYLYIYLKNIYIFKTYFIEKYGGIYLYTQTFLEGFEETILVCMCKGVFSIGLYIF